MTGSFKDRGQASLCVSDMQPNEMQDQSQLAAASVVRFVILNSSFNLAESGPRSAAIAGSGALPRCDDVLGQGFESLPIFLRHGNRNMASLAGIHIAYDAGLPSVSAGGDLALESIFKCIL